MFTHYPLRLIFFHTILLVFFSLDLTLAASVQDSWISPEPPDNTTVLTIGETFNIRWTTDLWEWFASYDSEADPTDVDLWITGFYQHQYQQLVTTRINVNTTYSTIWKVQLTSSDLAATPWWVFRFIKAGLSPADTSFQISSPGVYVRDTSATATSSAPSVTTSSSIASPTESESSVAVTTASGTSSAIATPNTTQSSTSSPNSGLSGGAIAGIVIGAVVGAAALVGIGWFFARRRPVKQDYRDPVSAYSSGAPQRSVYNSQEKQFVPERDHNFAWNTQTHQQHVQTQELDATRGSMHTAELENHR